MDLLIFLGLGVFALALVFAVFFKKIVIDRQIEKLNDLEDEVEKAKLKAKEIVEEAERDAVSKSKEIELKAKEKAYQIKEEIEKEVLKYLELVGLQEHKDKMPSSLSGGQKQRVSIARALISKPDVLLLDEPLSALDAKLRQNLLIELDLIHDEVGITFIFITHDQQEALSISDRIAVMNAGKVLQVGTPAEVYEAPADTFVADFLGENNFFSGKVTEIINEELAKINLEGIGEIIIELDKKVNVGDKVTISLRPEKIRLSKREIKSTKNFVNSASVYVDEYIYSGFQSKYYVHLKNNENLKFKIFMQHAAFFDDNDEKAIWWDEDAYITWDAYDGYLVEVESEKK